MTTGDYEVPVMVESAAVLAVSCPLCLSNTASARLQQRRCCGNEDRSNRRNHRDLAGYHHSPTTAVSAVARGRTGRCPTMAAGGAGWYVHDSGVTSTGHLDTRP